MTPDERYTQAAAYVDRVIEINRSREGVVKVTKKQRDRAVDQAAQLFRRVSATR